MAVRGKPVVTLSNQTTLLHASMRANSQKPDEFYAMVERLCPAPRYAELFARSHRVGWDGHGDQYPDYDAEADSVGSYYAAIAEIGRRVKAGEPVPECMLPRRSAP
jgi:N6-adenosine-specific RNA methylase IME4